MPFFRMLPLADGAVEKLAAAAAWGLQPAGDPPTQRGRSPIVMIKSKGGGGGGGFACGSGPVPHSPGVISAISMGDNPRYDFAYTRTAALVR